MQADSTTATTSGTLSSLHRIEPLRGTDNYNVWRIQMEDILTDLDLYKYVDRSYTIPSQTIELVLTDRKDSAGKDLADEKKTIDNEDYPKWFKFDRKALSNIRLRVDGSVLTHIQACTYSADAWDLLASTFQVKGTVGLIDLRRKFFSHRMAETEDIEEHIQQMRGWFQQINLIAPGTVTEVDWITTLVASLPDSWDTFTQSVSFRFSTDPNELANQISDLRSRILAEAHRRSTRNSESKAFFSSGKSNFNRNARTNPKPIDKSKTKCNNCGKIGHWAAECRGPGGGAYKRNQQNKANKGNFHNRRFDSPNKNRNGNARAHIAVSDDADNVEYAFSAQEPQLALISTDRTSWLADSGATTHIARDQDAFTTYSKSSGYITGVTGKEPIFGRGTIRLRCITDPNTGQYNNITLTNVAHVPGSPANLISLSLITDKGMRVSLEQDRLEVTGPNNRKVMIGSKMHDRAEGSLWRVNAQTISEPEDNRTKGEIALTKQTGRTWLDWHRILGHVNAHTLKRLKNSNAVEGMEVAEDKIGLNFECEACMQSKAHVKPFPKQSESTINEIGELVVTDVWGPARIASIGKFKYYVSFTDVATRFTSLGFLRHKDETLSHYKSFEAMLDTQKNKKIKRVRFDNGGEFVNNDWQGHAALKGTILETTAPYSAQQNGIAERLNRTLTEKARAMMLESGAPKFLWSEAIAYACYLKNRVPTQVHGTFWRTPYELFWNKKPDVSRLQPRGTKCYVLNQGESTSKLDPKTFTGIFTGISDVQGKSWRYYKTGANRILHSRNISFPRIYAHSTDVQQDPEWGETVVPPAEGERSQDSSAAERAMEPTGTGGETSVSTERTNDSKGKGMKQAIKPEVKVEQAASNSPSSTTPTQTDALKPPSRSKSTMVITPRTDTIDSLRQINALTNSTGTRPRRGDPNAPTITLRSERGGVKIDIKDSTATGQSSSEAKNEVSNLVVGFTDTSSSNGSEDSDSDDSDSIISGVPSLTTAPTIPSIASSPALNTVDLPAYSQLTGLETAFDKLTLADAFPTSTESPMADTKDNILDWSLAAQLASPSDNPTVDEALAGPDASKWTTAMETKVATLEKMGTFEPMELPPGRKAIGNKWVLTLKRDENGKPVRYKARLVAQGFSQQPGIDFGHTYAPVVRLDSIRAVASLANHFDWDLRQLDVSSAYLHADIDEELYMRQIPYFEDQSDKVLRIKRSLYGLKQAGRMWNKLFDSKLKELGYLPCKTDACVYRRIINVEGEIFVSILAIHVDDIMVATSRNHTDFVIEELLHTFKMRDLGSIRHFLGISFTRDQSAGLQTAYAAHTPMTPNIQLTRFEGTKPKFYYGMFIAQFTTCYGPAHVTAVKHVIRYLKGTLSRGLTYRRSNDGFGEIGYSDADWGSNLLDRKSISGNVFLLGGAAISWSAKKQATVALSTMEAEYMALSHACTQALWFRQFFDEIGHKADAPTLILSDNLAALTLSVELQYHGRSKHIDICHHFMRDIIKQRKVSTLYVPSKENLADAFTKALPAPQFSYLAKVFMGEPFATITEVEDDE
ncbi:integrase core domain protein [Ceratobasidium sp. AG-Ba]|nr:integrase core domain protein [Ceratobasidium sp. AG-Ba]